MWVARIDNQIHQPQCLDIPDFASKHRFEDVVVDRGKILFDVALEDVAVLAAEFGKAVDSFVSPLAFPTSVRIEDERPIENRLNDVTQCVVDNSVTIRCGTNFPQLRFINVKFVI